MTVLIVAIIVSAALIAGAVWGLYGPLGERTEGAILALAGGALILSVVTELIEPASEKTSVIAVSIALFVGAGIFTLADWLIKRKWQNSGGGGLLAAITLDGVPENLALGVALIGAGPMEVAALAGSIFLSNLPEAAGGAREMRKDGNSSRKIMMLWVTTAVMLSACTVAGNMLLSGVSDHWLSLIRSFAAGAVVASLATEVFPQAFKEDRHMAGLATAAGVILTLYLSQLGG